MNLSPSKESGSGYDVLFRNIAATLDSDPGAQQALLRTAGDVEELIAERKALREGLQEIATIADDYPDFSAARIIGVIAEGCLERHP